MKQVNDLIQIEMTYQYTGDYGTEKDGSKSKDYCKYCYQNGEFTSDVTLEEMIDFCVPKTAEATGMSEEEARKMLNDGRDAEGNFYSMYTWASLMYFISDLWK